MSSADEIIVKVFIPKGLKHKPKIKITSLGYFLGKTSFKDKTDRKGISPMAIGDSLDMSLSCIENYEDWKNEHNGASKIIILYKLFVMEFFFCSLFRHALHNTLHFYVPKVFRRFDGNGSCPELALQ